ncbi:MAG: hypothetical protein NC084_07160 [Bacteroides sp.]|nr:hypothetical protein [Eubacterium sp.]MCM1418376.1 hypothetical protein [Roseburia sp.]MCM1462477.1 hypothetical protein [Bacteroides sp.]
MNNRSDTPCRKAVNFDLGTNALKEHYPGDNYRDAYSDIKKFMERHGFEHRQYSGYNSKEPMEDIAVSRLIAKLSNEFSWLKECVQKIDSTNIGEQHDLTDIVKNTKDIGIDKSKNPMRKSSTQKRDRKLEQPKESELRPSVIGAIEEIKAKQRNSSINNKSHEVTHNNNDQSR